MRFLSLLSLLCLTFMSAFTQVEIPQSNTGCRIQKKGNFTYCLDSSTYKTNWTAYCLKGSSIENKEYIPTDKEFFRNMPSSIDPIWKKIVMQTQMWAMDFDSVYIVTGIKEYMVDSIIKTAYYKAVLKGCQGDGLGFWVPSEASPVSSLKDYAMALNKLEEKTGMDFFPSLNTDLQEIFESEFNWEFWPVIVE